MANLSKELKKIRDLIQKVKRELNIYTDMRDKKNEIDIAETQNALIEADIVSIEETEEEENAICDLSAELDEGIADLPKN